MDRLSAIRTIREKLSNGYVTLGSWIQIPHSSVAEIMGQAGYEWIAVDMEHGSVSPHQLPDLFRALELGCTLPLARLARGHAKDCKQALDAGAGGVIVPMIETANQLRAIRDACCWPPVGNRGVGFSRANLFGKNFDVYREEASSPLLVAMIENIAAVDQLDEILEVEGLDAILVGPYDLSASMGLTGMFGHENFKVVMRQIQDNARKKGIASGVHVVQPDKAELTCRIEEGYRFLPYSIDAQMLLGGAECPDMKGVG
jgi:2-dehydro-3-deoxyglucarate aldolase